MESKYLISRYTFFLKIIFKVRNARMAQWEKALHREILAIIVIVNFIQAKHYTKSLT